MTSASPTSCRVLTGTVAPLGAAGKPSAITKQPVVGPVAVGPRWGCRAMHRPVGMPRPASSARWPRATAPGSRASWRQLRARGLPLVALDYLPAQAREQARQLARRLSAEGLYPALATPKIQRARHWRHRSAAAAHRADLRSARAGTDVGLLGTLGYRVDYLADASLAQQPAAGTYAGVVTWMTAGVPDDDGALEAWLAARLDESVPLAIIAGLPVESQALLQRLGLRREDPPAAARLRCRSRPAPRRTPCPPAAGLLRLPRDQAIHAVGDSTCPPAPSRSGRCTGRGSAP